MAAKEARFELGFERAGGSAGSLQKELVPSIPARNARAFVTAEAARLGYSNRLAHTPSGFDQTSMTSPDDELMAV